MIMKKINYRKASIFTIMAAINLGILNLNARNNPSNTDGVLSLNDVNNSSNTNDEQYKKQRTNINISRQKENISIQSTQYLNHINQDCTEAEALLGKIQSNNKYQKTQSQKKNTQNKNTQTDVVQNKLNAFDKKQKDSSIRDNKISCEGDFFNLEKVDKNMNFQGYSSISDTCFYKEDEKYVYIKGINNIVQNNYIKNIKIEDNDLTESQKDQIKFAYYCTNNILERAINNPRGEEFKLIFGNSSQDNATYIVNELRNTLSSQTPKLFSQWTKKVNELIQNKNPVQIMQLLILTSINDILKDNNTDHEYYRFEVRQNFHKFVSECRLKIFEDRFIMDKLIPLLDECEELKSIQDENLIKYENYSLDKHIDSVTRFMINKLRDINDDKERYDFISGFVDSIARIGNSVIATTFHISDQNSAQFAKCISDFIKNGEKYLDQSIDLSQMYNRFGDDKEKMKDKNDLACMILRGFVAKLLTVVAELDTMRYVIKSLTNDNVLAKIKEIGGDNELDIDKSKYIQEISTRVKNIFGNNSHVRRFIDKLESKKISGVCSYKDISNLMKEDSGIVINYYRSFIYGNCTMFGVGSDKILLQECLDNDMKNKNNKRKIDGLKNIESYVEDMSGLKVNFTNNYLHGIRKNNHVQLKNSYSLKEKDNIKKFSESLAYEYGIRKTTFEYIQKQGKRFETMMIEIRKSNAYIMSFYEKYSKLANPKMVIEKQKRNKLKIMKDALESAAKLESMRLGLDMDDELSFGIQGNNVGQLTDVDYKYSKANDIQDITQNYNKTKCEIDQYEKYESNTNTEITNVLEEASLMNSNNEREMQAKLDDQISKNTQEKEKIRLDIANSTNELNQIDDKIKALEDQLSQSKKQKEDVNKNISNLKKKSTDLESFIDKLKNNNISLPQDRNTMAAMRAIISNINTLQKKYYKDLSSKNVISTLTEEVTTKIADYHKTLKETEVTIAKASEFKKKLFNRINTESNDYVVANNKSKLKNAIEDLRGTEGYNEFMECIRTFTTFKNKYESITSEPNTPEVKCELNLQYLSNSYFESKNNDEIITEIFTSGMLACINKSNINDNKKNFVSDINKIIEAYSVFSAIELAKRGAAIKNMVKKIEESKKTYTEKIKAYKEKIEAQIKEFQQMQKKSDDMALIS